jgi:hypothetical protein
METNLKIIGMSRKSENGHTIDNKSFDLSYDGNYADINTFVNDKNSYVRLNNNELIDLLNKPVSKETLENRLMSDFNISPKILSSLSPLSRRSNKSKSKSRSSRLTQKISSKQKKMPTSSKKINSSIYNYSYPFKTLNKLEIPKLSLQRFIPPQFKPPQFKPTQLKKSTTRKSTSRKPTSRKPTSRKSTSRKSSKYAINSKSKPSSNILSKRLSTQISNQLSNQLSNNYNRSRRTSTQKYPSYMSDLLSPTKSMIKTPSQLLYNATPYVKEGSEKISQLLNKPSEIYKLSNEKPIDGTYQTRESYVQNPQDNFLNNNYNENQYMNESYLPSRSQNNRYQ